MDYKTQITSAVEKRKIKKGYLKEINITDSSVCLSAEEQKTIKDLSSVFSKNQCMDNSCLVMQKLNIPCCEGVAYIVPDKPENIKNEGDWIKHSWNKKENCFFDVTKEYVFPRINAIPREIHYFLISEYRAEAYKKQKAKKGTSGFLSNAEEIKEILKEINNEITD